MEAEYRSVSFCSDNVLWLRHVLGELGYSQKEPTAIFMDSRGAQLATYNPVQGHRLRHVELDVHVIKERVERKEVLPIWIDKNLQVADIFTKPLPKGLFQIFRNVLFGLRRAKLPTTRRTDLEGRHYKYKTSKIECIQRVLTGAYGNFQTHYDYDMQEEGHRCTDGYHPRAIG